MRTLKDFLKRIRDPFGDRERMIKQEAYLDQVTSDIADLRLANNPYRTINPQYRKKREVVKKGERYG